MKIKNAFTLAEVLITLAIIGVVAALTLPVVTDKIGDIVLQNQRKKAQSVLANGIKMMLAQENETDLANTDLKKCGADRNCLAAEIGKYFKVTTDSNSKNDLFAMMYEFGAEDAIASEITQLQTEQKLLKDEMVKVKITDLSDLKVNTKSINGDYAVWQDPGMNYAFVTSDGMVFGIMNNNKSSNTLTILADVNGASTPNAGGRDLCTYNISSAGALSENCSSSFIPTAVEELKEAEDAVQEKDYEKSEDEMAEEEWAEEDYEERAYDEV